MHGMLIPAAVNIGFDLLVGIGALLVIWVTAAAMTAGYGRERGFPFFPLFIAALFLGFPLVLLAVTVGGRGERVVVDRDGRLLQALNLRESGALTEDEFRAAQGRILAD